MTKKIEDKMGTFIDIVDSCSGIVNSDPESTNETLVNVMMQNTGCSRKEAQKSINEVIRTVDRIENVYNDLRDSMSKGSTREEWLIAKIQGLDTSKTGLSMNKILVDVGRELNVPSVSEDASLSDSDLGNIRETVIIQDIVDTMQNTNFLEPKAVERVEAIDFKKEIVALRDYFDTPLNNDKDPQYVKAVSSAAVIAKEKGMLPEQFDKVTNSQLTMIVDQGMSAAKAVYQVGTGEINPIEAQGYILNRKTSKLGAVIEDFCAEAGENIGANIGASVGSIFGPAGSYVGSEIGAFVGNVAGRAVGKVITKGVEVVSNVITSVGNFISNAASAISDFFFSW